MTTKQPEAKPRSSARSLVGGQPVLIEDERGVVLAEDQRASFPTQAIGPPADEAAPGTPFKPNAAQRPRPPPLGRDDDDTFIDGVGLRRLFGGVSHMWVKRQMQTRGFPRPHYVGSYPYWSLRAVRAWWTSQPTTPPPVQVVAGERGVEVLKEARRRKKAEAAPSLKPAGRRAHPPKPLPAAE